MRPLTAILAVGAYVAAGSAVPFSWSHTLSESCHWLPRPFYDRLGLVRGDPSANDNMARAACFARRGLASDSLSIRDLRRQWPSEVEITAWRNAR